MSLFGWGVLSVFLHMSAVMILYVSALGWLRVSICFWGALVSEFACVFFGVVLSQCLCWGIVISGLAFCCFLLLSNMYLLFGLGLSVLGVLHLWFCCVS